jgi:hypothetical protein
VKKGHQRRKSLLEEHLRLVTSSTPPDFVVIQVCTRSTTSEDVEILDMQKAYDCQLHGFQFSCALTITSKSRSTHPSKPMSVKLPSNIHGGINKHPSLVPSMALTIFVLLNPPHSSNQNMYRGRRPSSCQSDELVCLNTDMFLAQSAR